MTRDPHPTLAPAVRALRDATRGDEATPCSAEDLASRLESLHNLTDPDTVFTALADVLDRLAESLPQVPDLTDEQRDLIGTWLERAGERLPMVTECLDHARLATGKWER